MCQCIAWIKIDGIIGCNHLEVSHFVSNLDGDHNVLDRII
jgi:hypothetical protein